jgi:hypothetical protein
LFDYQLELVTNFSVPNVYVGDITTPETALLGATTMRIRIQGTTPPTSACGTGGYEVEDYKVILADPCISDFEMDAPFATSNTTEGAGGDISVRTMFTQLLFLVLEIGPSPHVVLDITQKYS